jgi:hypothetical protein
MSAMVESRPSRGGLPNDGLAPSPAVRDAAIEPRESTLMSHFLLCQRAVEATKKRPFARHFCTC